MSTPSITPSLLSNGADLTSASAGSATGSKDSRIHKAAQQFEALMITEMMKTVREGGEEGGWLGSGDETGDDTSIGMAESQFSQAMAAHGGLGLAHMIEQNVGREQVDRNSHTKPGQLPPSAH